MSTADRSPSSARRFVDEPESSRDKILDVAEALFARSGFAGVGLREVATAVGLGKSSLFHHFKTKQQLYIEVLHRVLGRIGVQLQPAFESSASAAERLDRVSDAMVDVLAEHPTTARLLLRALFEDDLFPSPAEPTPESEAVDALLAELIARFQTLLRDGIEQGVFRPVSIAHATQTIIGAAVFHFASGEFGEIVMGGSLFSAESVARRRRELRSFLRSALLSGAADADPERS